MVVIRLTRAGSKKRPFYHVVVTDKRKPRDGGFIERVGYYNPIVQDADKYALNLDVVRINYWIGNGAQPSERVQHLIKTFSNLPLQLQPQLATPAPAISAPSAPDEVTQKETIASTKEE